MGGGGGGVQGEIEFHIKSNLNKKLSVQQPVLYTFGQGCLKMVFSIDHVNKVYFNQCTVRKVTCGH